MIKYRPEIDGLRAVSVVLVMLFHAKIDGVGGGFIGVDVFFVISGFLITSLIVTDISKGTFSFTDFWVRRARRILPAVFVVIVFSLVLGWSILLPGDYRLLGQSAAAQAVFGSNFLFWNISGYFGPDAESLPLLHTWSLAVEEQFYLLFPPLIFGLSIAVKRLRFWSILFGAMISFVVSVRLAEGSPDAAFYLLPSRAWELGVGALLALWLFEHPAGATKIPRAVNEFASAIGIAMILFAAFTYDTGTLFPGFAGLLPVGGAALIIWSNTGTKTLTGNALSLKPFVFVGLISYSLYLWHWPLLVFTLYPTGNSELPPVALGGVLVLSVGASYLTWRFIEQPFRKRRVLVSNRVLLGGAATSIAVIGGLGLFIQIDNSSTQPPSATAATTGAVDAPTTVAATPEFVSEGRPPRELACLRDANELPPITGIADFCLYGSGLQTPSFVLWGDSHADVLITAMDSLADRNGITGLHAGYTSCPPFLGITRPNRASCGDFNDSVVRVMKENGIETVILAARWSSYISNPGVLIPTSEDVPGYEVWETEGIGLRLLEYTAETLLAEGFDVWLVRDVPAFAFNPGRRLVGVRALNQDPSSIGKPYQNVARSKAAFDRVAFVLQESGVRLIDLPAHICVDSFCPVIRDDTLLYRDQDHLSVGGSYFVAPAFQPVFDSLRTGN